MIPVSSSGSTDGCVPVSSNCIIWQGPDIPCIDLCTGDSVSDVVYKLATELCDLLNQTNISNIDLSCLNLSPSQTPQDFQELVQVIIDKLCSLDGRCTSLEDNPGGGGGSSTINVTVANCHISELGAVEVAVDVYAEFLGTKICAIASSITTLQTTVSQHTTQISNLQTQINNLGSATLPQVIPNCVLPSVPTDMDDVLIAVESQLCDLKQATGEAFEIISSTGYQCVNLTNLPRQSGSGTMSGIPGWKNPVTNLADSVTNLWLTVCDMRAALQNVIDNCCSTNCDDLILSYAPSINGAGDTVTISVAGSVIPSGFYSCNPAGAIVQITDTFGAVYTDYIDVASLLSTSSSYTLSLGTTNLTQGTTLTVNIQSCFTDGSLTCEKAFNATLTGTVACPTLTLDGTQTTVSWEFTHVLGINVSYNIELLQNSAVVGNMYVINEPNGIQTGTFTNLSAGVAYQVRITVLVPGANPQACTPANITTDSATEFFWQVSPCEIEAPLPANNAVRTFDPTVQLGSVVTLTGSTYQGYCYTITDVSAFPNAVLIASVVADCNSCLT